MQYFEADSPWVICLKKNSWDFYVCAVNKSGKKYPCMRPVVFKPCQALTGLQKSPPLNICEFS